MDPTCIFSPDSHLTAPSNSPQPYLGLPVLQRKVLGAPSPGEGPSMCFPLICEDKTDMFDLPRN